MWLLTTRGFYSVVANRHDPELVLVRTRVRDDLEGLRDLVPELEIEHTPRADYEWRAAVRRPAWTAVVCSLAAGIDYGNFKDAVAHAQGLDRASLYAIVWATLRDLQSPPRHQV